MFLSTSYLRIYLCTLFSVKGIACRLKVDDGGGYLNNVFTVRVYRLVSDIQTVRFLGFPSTFQQKLLSHFQIQFEKQVDPYRSKAFQPFHFTINGRIFEHQAFRQKRTDSTLQLKHYPKLTRHRVVSMETERIFRTLIH